jgi:hypothetical protein
MILLLLICLIIIIIIIYLNRKKEKFEEKSPITSTDPTTGTGRGGGAASASASAAAAANDKLSLIITPIVATVNNIVDSFNGLTSKVYDNSIAMSQKIGGKVKEYAETMKTFNRSADDCEGLRNVVINEVHKKYIDDLVKNHDPLYGKLASQADKFYKVPFEEQNIELIKIITDLSKSNNRITPLLEKKIQEMLAD